jgi:hypothetical protein
LLLFLYFFFLFFRLSLLFFHPFFFLLLGALLNNLFFALAQTGDVILIPAPYYAAFENNARVVAGCLPFSVQLR